MLTTFFEWIKQLKWQHVLMPLWIFHTRERRHSVCNVLTRLFSSHCHALYAFIRTEKLSCLNVLDALPAAMYIV